MNLYYNLPSKQRRVQQLVTLFNTDEQLWESLKGKRRLRRTLFPWLWKKQQKQLDLLDFEGAPAARLYGSNRGMMKFARASRKTMSIESVSTAYEVKSLF